MSKSLRYAGRSVLTLSLLLTLSVGALADIDNLMGSRAYCDSYSARVKGETPPVQTANDVAWSNTFYNVDFVVAGVAGLRDYGYGTITISGINGPVTRALLYWHGPTNSSSITAMANISLNGTPVTGTNIGLSSDNCWGYANSQAYVADVTTIVAATGNGNYAWRFSGSLSLANPNGASLIVFFDDGNDENNRDVVMFHGNDSNIDNPYDAPGWNVTLAGIDYETGTANLQLHVGDGQVWQDDDVRINGDVLAPCCHVFDGNTVPSSNSGPSGNGALWDIRSWDITAWLNPDPDNNDVVEITTGGYSDCLSLVLAIIDLPAGAAPPPPGELVYGYVTTTSGDLPLMGVPVQVVDPPSSLIGSAVTDESGYYEIIVPEGDYQVGIAQMPLGYAAASPTPVDITMDGENIQVDFALAENCPNCDVVSLEYWQWNVNGAICHWGGMPYPADRLMCLLGKIHAHFDPFFPIYANVQSLCDMRQALRIPSGSCALVQAKAYFFAVLLNVAACRLPTYEIVSTDGATASQAITYIAGLITDGNPANDCQAMRLARSLTWSWVTLPAGSIPLDIPQIAYKLADDVPVPGDFSLSQNYPNPFNPTTEIRFNLPATSDITFTVYNALGQTVTEEHFLNQSAGEHVLVWDGSGKASGVYFYRIEAGSLSEVKKMVLMK